MERDDRVTHDIMATAKVYPVSDELKLANNNNDENFATKLIRRRSSYQANSDTEVKVDKESTSADKESSSVESPGRECVHKAVPMTDVIHQRFLTTILIIFVLVSVALLSLSLVMIFGSHVRNRVTVEPKPPSKTNQTRITRLN